MVFQYGTLTYRARSDGSPYAVINQARGTYTKLPDGGDKVDCGDVSIEWTTTRCAAVRRNARVPVAVGGRSRPRCRAAQRRTSCTSATPPRAQLDPSSDSFSSETAYAAQAAAARMLDEDQTGSLDLGQAVFLPGPLRIATVTRRPSARPPSRGCTVAQATSDQPPGPGGTWTPPSRSNVTVGDAGPDHAARQPHHCRGRSRASGQSRCPPSGSGRRARRRLGRPTIPVLITLDDPEAAGSLDQAPVQVEITTTGVRVRPDRPGHRARREVRRRVRGRGRARRRATRAGRCEAGPVRRRRRARPGRGRPSRRRSQWWCRRHE